MISLIRFLSILVVFSHRRTGGFLDDLGPPKNKKKNPLKIFDHSSKRVPINSPQL